MAVTMHVNGSSADIFTDSELIAAGKNSSTDRAADSQEGDSDGDAADDLEGGDELPATTIHKQRVLFKTWMLKAAAHDIEHGSIDRRHKHPEKEQLSISEIIGEQESEHIIDDPREYQLELFERAKLQNTIAVLDTGTGKTLIAVLLLRHVIEQELEDRMQGKPHRIAFFLVPAVNLVFQQQAVLSHNLNFEIARVFGAMGVDLWTKSKWDTLFDAHKVIVCTPEVLNLCLSHGFIRMDQINLLIFDEAHHAKREHPYCRIMREHFDRLDSVLQPRVFGMTASPVDAKAEDMDVIDLALGLEATLHSTIATTSKWAPLSTYVHRPRETKQYYPSLPSASRTPFGAEITSRYSHFHFLEGFSDRSAAINASLGSWCADRYWHLALPEKIAKKSDLHLEKYARHQDTTMDQSRNEVDVARMRELLGFISARSTLPPTAHSISQKVVALRSCLAEYFSRPSENRCIVFVRERYTATLLAELFNAFGNMHLKSGHLIGIGSMDLANPSSTFREQVLTLQKFRQGQLNCLFATSVAEEGLDVPSCNLIVRFDPCQTMIQYVQSRGRARHRNSTFVHMIESGNKDHVTMLENNQRAEQLMRSFCERLPEDRKLIGNEDILGAHSGQRGESVFEIAASGAKLTPSNAVVFLARFVSTLPNTGDEPLRPQYVVHPTLEGFVCEVVLPTCSPIRGAQGRIKRRKIFAKASAAFFTCIALREQGHLDDNLLPVYVDRLQTLRNAALALGVTGKTRYVMKNKPAFWHRGSQPTAMYGLLIDFSAGLEQPHMPVILLSRQRLDAFPVFPIYLNSGLASEVTTKPLTGKIDLHGDKLAVLTKSTLKVFKDVFNKTYEYDPTKMSYWLAPVMPSAFTGESRMDELLDWPAIENFCVEDDFGWTPELPARDLLDKFLVDPFNGGKRYFTKSLAEGIKASDPNPDLVKADGTGPTVIETTVSLFKKSKMRATWNPDQPVLVADRVLHRRNMLAEVIGKDPEEKSRCHICPQPLRISRLAAKFAATCYALPAVIWRIESYLIADEAFRLLDLHVTPSLALEALTKDSDATGDYGEDTTTIKVKSGMGRNYERLEFLGDTFLKMATTIATYIKNPGDSEFDFHVKRMLQLCNANLLEVALKVGLTEHIRSQSFSRRTWYPEGIKLLEGKGHKKTGDEQLHHQLGKKTIADVSEAIIGACWLGHNEPGHWSPESWSHAVRAVTTLVDADLHNMMEWADYRRAYIVPEWQKKKPRAYEVYTAEKMEHLHDYHFENPRLLHAVFTHPSMPVAYESVKSYQQLEFLGDSLLDMACVSHLMYRYPDKDPQWLTEHKMAMVANKFLGALCVMLGFHPNLRHNTHGLGNQIKNYAEELEEAKRVSGGAVDFWTTVQDPPKALADIVEAYVGAMFLDSGFDYSQVQRFFDQHMLPYFEDMEVYDHFANSHPVVRLHRLLGETLGCRGYRVFAEEEPAVDSGPPRAYAALIVHNSVLAGDISQSTRYGKARSAAKALKELEGLSVPQFRSKYSCDCKAEVADVALETAMEMDTTAMAVEIETTV
ncbi:Dicer-like protein 1 [Sphaceloma murrayae]|uniref:Dicer-like protein 1 n=1 Tax=Sphaceloma murrayae TaxID=2082308 RepID=A0A2K1QUV8_9PEZI|nr:Dicer-like protein 1 [Sphaceloma murrayae]